MILSAVRMTATNVHRKTYFLMMQTDKTVPSTSLLLKKKDLRGGCTGVPSLWAPPEVSSLHVSSSCISGFGRSFIVKRRRKQEGRIQCNEKSTQRHGLSAPGSGSAPWTAPRALRSWLLGCTWLIKLISFSSSLAQHGYLNIRQIKYVNIPLFFSWSFFSGC